MKKFSVVFALVMLWCFAFVGCKKVVVTDYVLPSAPTTKELITETVTTTKVITVPLYVDLGKFMLTAYCPCCECSDKYGDMTATGVKAKEGRTIAVDEDVIPYGCEVIIGGNTYRAEDCGGKVIGKHIDIYFESHKEAENFGVQYADVLLKVGKGG